MKIGAMNNPGEPAYKWVKWVGKNGFDYIDFTVEPPAVMPEQIDAVKIKSLLKKYNLGIVGHIGDWRLPKESGYKSLREASKKEIIKAIRVLALIGAKKITMHGPDHNTRRGNAYDGYSEVISAALAEAKKSRVKLMIENGDANEPEYRKLLEKILSRFPSLYLHIDVGHTNILTKKNLVYYYLAKYKKRVLHFHFSDNKGKDDDHKYLGYGNIDWKKLVVFLKKSRYDGTITLETFRSGKEGTVKSLKKLRKLWDTN